MKINYKCKKCKEPCHFIIEFNENKRTKEEIDNSIDKNKCMMATDSSAQWEEDRSEKDNKIEKLFYPNTFNLRR